MEVKKEGRVSRRERKVEGAETAKVLEKSDIESFLCGLGAFNFAAFA